MGFSLHTARLTLRDYEPKDYDVVHEVFLHPALAAFHLRNQANEDYVNEHFIFGRFQMRMRPRMTYDLAVVSASGESLGICGLKRDLQRHNSGKLSWHLRPTHWNQGYATEAATRLLEFGFEELGLSLIEASAFADNWASIRVMEKIGLLTEMNNSATTWWRGLCLGESRSVVSYALSQKEWLANRPRTASQTIASQWLRAA